MNKNVLILIYVLVGILVATSAFGNWYFWKKFSEKSKEVTNLQSQIEALKKEAEEKEASENKKNEEKVNEYAGCWKTYTNNTIGYKLKYPCDWTLEEIDTYSETIGTQVKYITITTPDKKYFLHFGIKKIADTFNITDRTGVGAGDWQDDGTLTILGKVVKVTNLAYSGKVKEKFYPKPSGTIKTDDGKYVFLASFSYGASTNYDTIDMTNLSYVTLAKKILKSVEEL